MVGVLVPFLIAYNNNKRDVDALFLAQPTLRIIHHLSSNTRSEPPQVLSTLISALALLVEDDVVEMSQLSTQTLNNIGRENSEHSAFGRTGAISALTRAIQSQSWDELTVAEAVGALSSLAREDANRDQIIECGGVEAMLRVLRATPTSGSSVSCVGTALDVLISLIKYPSARRRMVTNGVPVSDATVRRASRHTQHSKAQYSHKRS